MERRFYHTVHDRLVKILEIGTQSYRIRLFPEWEARWVHAGYLEGAKVVPRTNEKAAIRAARGDA